MEGKIVIGLIFVFSATINQAQNNKFVPPDWTPKKHSFALPELQVDSIFIDNLIIVLFDKNDRYMNNIMSNPREKLWRHFHIQFAKKDSLNYCMEVSLWDIPARESIGFFEHNGYFYWFGDDTPPNIILKKKSKRRFSYKEDIVGFYDPPFWTLMYRIPTGSIEVKEKNYH
jgi:hypothetical protein